MRKMVPHLQIEKREWEEKAGSDDNFCVGKRFVGRRSVDTDESDEKCDRQLECTYSKHDTGDQERGRRGDGSVVEKIPSSWTRNFEEKRPDTVEHGRETHPQMGGSRGETSDKPLASGSGESKSSTVLAMGAAAPHRQVDGCPPRNDSKSSGGKISCADGTARGARKTRGKTRGGGKMLKTVCLGVVLRSEHSTEVLTIC